MSLEDFGDKPTPRNPNQPAPIRTDAVVGQAPQQEPKPPGDIVQWACCADNRFMAAPDTTLRLPPAAYTFVPTQQGIQIITKRLIVDELLEFPDSRQGEILQEIEDFWGRASIFKHYNVRHRRGYMFHGPAGSGKTCLVQQIMARVIAGGDIVAILDGHPAHFRSGLQLVRQVEPERRIVAVIEDIDAVIAQFGEDEILSLLDGENQIDHVLNLATTNYPERLDKRLVNRPRRYDRILKVGMPTAKMRELYFLKKLKLPAEELAKWVKATEDFSFAACCELLISVMCLGRDFEKSVQKLKDMLTAKPSSTADVSARAGFAGTIDNQEE